MWGHLVSHAKHDTIGTVTCNKSFGKCEYVAVGRFRDNAKLQKAAKSSIYNTWQLKSISSLTSLL